jgi:hypothetical protein
MTTGSPESIGHGGDRRVREIVPGCRAMGNKKSRRNRIGFRTGSRPAGPAID